MATYAKDLDTAEEAYAAISEMDKVFYIQYIKVREVTLLVSHIVSKLIVFLQKITHANMTNSFAVGNILQNIQTFPHLYTLFVCTFTMKYYNPGSLM